jgi:hypothetical protein
LRLQANIEKSLDKRSLSLLCLAQPAERQLGLLSFEGKVHRAEVLTRSGPENPGTVRSSSPLVLREFRERAEYSEDEEVAEKSACLSVRELSLLGLAQPAERQLGPLSFVGKVHRAEVLTRNGHENPGAVRSSSPLVLREFRERAEYSEDEEVAEKSECLSVREVSRCAEQFDFR